MSRAQSLNWYQIEVVDESRRDKHPRETKLHNSFVDFSLQDKVKLADIPNPLPVMTVFRHAKDNESAKRSIKFGTVLSCFKVHDEPYLEKAERYELLPMPTITVSLEGVNIDKDMNVIVQNNGVDVQLQ